MVLAPEWLKKYSSESPVVKAFNLASILHQKTKREDGQPYIVHPLAVAEFIHQLGLDENSIAAAFLHDVVEDENYPLQEIEKKFGSEVAFLVESLTKLEKLNYIKKENYTHLEAENFRKLVIAFSKDIRVLIIKLADRYHNMKTLAALPPERQKRYAQETLEIYAPLAYRLGIQKLSGELEDLAFPYVYPEEYQWLLSNVKERYEEREAYAQKLKPIVKENLEKHGLKPLRIESRAKRYFSLYRKLLRNNMDFNKIYDLVALRIITQTVEECYLALGIIHHFWPPLPGRIKDYIARPKPNGYRSLHTTVFCVNDKITEIQIRTEEMDQEAEFGIAAYWAYAQIKENKDYQGKWHKIANQKEIRWMAQLREWQKYFSGSEEYLESVKTDFLKERIFVLTPKNDVIDLPRGATPVDFAYKIHSEIGNTCVGAKVNGKVVPLDYQLNSGDIVEIITQKRKKPSEKWLRFVKTDLARKHIQRALKEKDKKLKKQVQIPEGFVEFKITNRDRPGYLKEITDIFSQMKINITYLKSLTDHRGYFAKVIIRIPKIEKSKLDKISIEIKKIKGTEEVGWVYKN